MYKSIPMTFAGGPTYMPEFLKEALKEKMFQCILSLTKKIHI